MKKYQVEYELLTFTDKPNTIGLVVRGATPPDDDGRGLVDFVCECAQDFTPEMQAALMAKPNLAITINNDPSRPSTEMFVMYRLPFRIGARELDCFVQGAERFIQKYFFGHLWAAKAQCN